MKYTPENINFDKISSSEFEQVCYDLLKLYNFENLIWREGGADNGRDIEAEYRFINSLADVRLKYFIECKKYKSGVPPVELNSKIAWADAEQPDYLIIIVSSYLTNNCRNWLEQIKDQKSYRILVIEGVELKSKICAYDLLVERYFSVSKYVDLFTTLKRLDNQYNVDPNWPIIQAVINNIDVKFIDENDAKYLLLAIYRNIGENELRNEFAGDFNPAEANYLIEFLFKKGKDDNYSSFEKISNISLDLSGLGFAEVDIEDKNRWGNYPYPTTPNYQVYHLHVNHKENQQQWRIAYYLIILHSDYAIEILWDNGKFYLKKRQNWAMEQLKNTIVRLSDAEVDRLIRFQKYLDEDHPALDMFKNNDEDDIPY